jgi:hypothetical protein
MGGSKLEDRICAGMTRTLGAQAPSPRGWCPGYRESGTSRWSVGLAVMSRVSGAGAQPAVVRCWALEVGPTAMSTAGAGSEVAAPSTTDTRTCCAGAVSAGPMLRWQLVSRTVQLFAPAVGDRR